MQSPFKAIVAGSITSLLLLAGCHDGPKGPPRVQTVPITGQVLVDGKPPQDRISVSAVPLDGPTPTNTTPGAFTDPEGKFSLGTYESGDGIPVGDYALTFRWGKINMLSGRYEGDKFEGRYADPETSEHKVTVTEDSEPIDVGKIELTIN